MRSWHVPCSNQAPAGRPGLEALVAKEMRAQAWWRITPATTKEVLMNSRELNGRSQSGREPTNLVTETKDYIVSAIDGVGDVGKATVDAVSGTLAHSIRGTRSVGAELLGLVVDTITGAVHAVAEVGGEVGGAAKSIMVGALRGTQQVGKVGAETVSTSAAAVVKGASEVGGSVAEAAKGAVEGAIEAARDLGMSAEDAASAAGSGVIQAAGEISSTALEQVQNVMTKTISGVKVVLKEPFRPGSRNVDRAQTRG